MKNLFVAIAICLLCFTQSSADITQWMVDMSSHNAGVQVLKGMTFEGNNSKIEMIIHRLTIGRYTQKSDADKLFSKRSFETYSEGLYFGAYHVLYPSSDPKPQAQGFVRALKEQTTPGQKVIMALDWEHVCVKWNYNEQGKKQTCAQEGLVPPSFVIEFAKEVERLTGNKPIIYTSARELKLFRKYFDTNPQVVADLTRYPLWIARYEGKFGYGFPTEEEIHPWYDWTFWQFAEGKRLGPTKRISPKIKNNPIDTNFFNGSREEIETFFKTYAWEAK